MRIREVFGLGVLAWAMVVPARLWAQAPQPTPAPAAPATTEVPAPTSRVAAVLERDGDGTDLKARLTAAQALGNELQPGELEALYAFLDRKAGEDALPVDKLAVIKNDVANALLNQTRPPREFGPCLVRMFSDRTHDTLWRDFCAQFLGRWYPRTGGDERARIRDVLWEATAETDTQVAGTALIALRDNVGQGDRSPRVTWESVAMRFPPTTGALHGHRARGSCPPALRARIPLLMVGFWIIAAVACDPRRFPLPWVVVYCRDFGLVSAGR